MRHIVTRAGLPILAAGAVIAAAWSAPARPEPATVSGAVVDVACKFTTGQSGPTHVACAQMCAKAGVPLAILTADGKLYFAAKHGEGPNARLLEFVEEQVVATGKVFPAAGAYTIEIETIKKGS